LELLLLIAKISKDSISSHIIFSRDLIVLMRLEGQFCWAGRIMIVRGAKLKINGVTDDFSL